MLITPTTMVTDLTVAQLLECIDEHLAERQQSASKRIHGINGLAEYLGCSKRTASRLVASGQIDKSIIRIGRTISFDEGQLRKCCRLKY